MLAVIFYLPKNYHPMEKLMSVVIDVYNLVKKSSATPQHEKFIEYGKGKNLHASMAPQLQINSPAHLLGIY